MHVAYAADQHNADTWQKFVNQPRQPPGNFQWDIYLVYCQGCLYAIVQQY